MNINLLKKHILGLAISLLLVIVNIELIQKNVDVIFENYFINLDNFAKYCFEPIVMLITLAGIILTYYFIIKIFALLIKKDAK